MVDKPSLFSYMHKTLTFLTIGVIAILAFTTAAYIVLIRFDADIEVRRMMIAMSNLETVSQDTGFSWTRGVSDERVNTTLYTSGQMDISSLSEIEHETIFRVVHIGNDESYTDLSGEIRSIDEKTYLTYAPPGPEVPGISFSEEKTWISFMEDEMLSWGSILPGLDFPIEVSDEKTSWTPEGIGRLRYLLAAADIFVSDHNGLTELIGGVNTRIIDAAFDNDVVEAFLHDIVRAKEGRDPTDQERVLAAVQADQLKRLSFRFWIGIDDHLLYRMQAAGAFTEEGSTDLIPVDINASFEDFNEPFEAQEPTQVLTFNEVIQSVFANLPDAEDSENTTSLGSSTLVSDETARLPVEEVEQSDDPDEDGLNSMLEGFYGTDPNNPDTDGDGVSDGDEVRKGHNPRGSGSLFGFGLDR